MASNQIYKNIIYCFTNKHTRVINYNYKLIIIIVITILDCNGSDAKA